MKGEVPGKVKKNANSDVSRVIKARNEPAHWLLHIRAGVHQVHYVQVSNAAQVSLLVRLAIYCLWWSSDANIFNSLSFDFCYERFVLVACLLVSGGWLTGSVDPGESSERKSLKEKLLDVEAVDPGLLTPISRNGTGRAVLGNQFGNIPRQQGSSFAGSVNSFQPGIPGGSSFGPSSGGANFLPGSVGTNNFGPGQGVASFVPNSVQGGNYPLPGQAGNIIPGQGNNFFPGVQPNNPNSIPGQTGPLGTASVLPAGAVAQDTVAFSATRASDFTRSATTQVRFDFTITDIGYGWYPDRSEFVCFYPGVYFFTFSALSPQSRQFKWVLIFLSNVTALLSELNYFMTLYLLFCFGRLALIKNNQEIVSSWGDSNGYQMGTNSVILPMNANDRVYLVLQEGSLHETNTLGRGYTTFSGFRIR